MQDADSLPQLVRCDLYSDYNFPDTTRKRPRYQPFSAWCITD